MALDASDKHIKQRWCTKNESDEVGEEQVEAMKQSSEAANKLKEEMKEAFQEHTKRVNHIFLITDVSLETHKKNLQSYLQPRVIIVNHEKRLGIDTTCSNLAIKYDMIYVSAY